MRSPGLNTALYRKQRGFTLIELLVVSVRGLTVLTMYYLPDGKTRDELLRYLGLAEVGGGRGAEARRQHWLETYVQLLQKVRGIELPAVQADTLIRIARAL